MMSKTDKQMIKLVFEDMKNGKFPKFGSPEFRCDKCMFAGITCETSSEYVGCFGGWKRELD